MTARAITGADYERLLAFRIALRGFLRHSEGLTSALGLTPAVHQLLLVIRAVDAPPTVAEVAEVLAIRHHSAVELAQRAQRLGLVSRLRDEADHRRVRLSLTEAGIEGLEQITRQNLPAIAELARTLSDVTGR